MYHFQQFFNLSAHFSASSKAIFNVRIHAADIEKNTHDNIF